QEGPQEAPVGQGSPDPSDGHLQEGDKKHDRQRWTDRRRQPNGRRYPHRENARNAYRGEVDENLETFEIMAHGNRPADHAPVYGVKPDGNAPPGGGCAAGAADEKKLPRTLRTRGSLNSGGASLIVSSCAKKTIN